MRIFQKIVILSFAFFTTACFGILVDSFPTKYILITHNADLYLIQNNKEKKLRPGKPEYFKISELVKDGIRIRRGNQEYIYQRMHVSSPIGTYPVIAIYEDMSLSKLPPNVKLKDYVESNKFPPQLLGQAIMPTIIEPAKAMNGTE